MIANQNDARFKIKLKSKSSTTVQSVDESINQAKIAANQAKIERFKLLPHYKQKSQAWLDQRNNYLTASTIAAALGLMGPQSRLELLLNKASCGEYRTFFGNSATHWGNKYEPVANALYSYRNQDILIHEFGMVTNDQYPFLGVSPDGVTIHRLLEIKCPYSRVIDGKIKLEYFHQMQEQMLVCDFDECDFLECRFEEWPCQNFWSSLNDNTSEHPEKGIIIAYLDLEEENADDLIKYLYSPISLHSNPEKLKQWEKSTIANLGNNLYVQSSYWKLKIYHCQLVVRDDQWIIENYPILKDFWAEVELYRKIGFDKLLEKVENDKKLEYDQFTSKIPKLNQCLL